MIKYNDRLIEPTIFPDNTSQVWKIDESAFHGSHSHLIEWKFENEAELFHLMQLVQLIRAQRAGFGTRQKIYLRMDYLPYARQDKDISNQSTFALRTFATFINSLEFDKVYVFDVHSNEAKDFIINLEVTQPIKEIYTTIGNVNANTICYPDSGAYHKYSKFINHNFVYGHKDRDQTTGHINKLDIIGEVKGDVVLIVDDICDGGGTFILTANELYKKGAKEVHLYVSHGLFTKGLEGLKEAGIKRIFTKDGEVK